MEVGEFEDASVLLGLTVAEARDLGETSNSGRTHW